MAQMYLHAAIFVSFFLDPGEPGDLYCMHRFVRTDGQRVDVRAADLGDLVRLEGLYDETFPGMSGVSVRKRI
jgi:hypothetical protein